MFQKHTIPFGPNVVLTKSEIAMAPTNDACKGMAVASIRIGRSTDPNVICRGPPPHILFILEASSVKPYHSFCRSPKITFSKNHHPINQENLRVYKWVAGIVSFDRCLAAHATRAETNSKSWKIREELARQQSTRREQHQNILGRLGASATQVSDFQRSPHHSSRGSAAERSSET